MSCFFLYCKFTMGKERHTSVSLCQYHTKGCSSLHWHGWKNSGVTHRCSQAVHAIKADVAIEEAGVIQLQCQICKGLL